MATVGKSKEEGAPYRLGGMGYQDASGRRLSYGSYLHLSELLAAQDGLTKAHDELLFIVVHQVYELWFKVLIHELDAVRAAIEAEDLRGARHYLNRVKVIEALLVEQVGVLETMAPQDFLTFRSELAPASGFQSAQFREIEFMSGLKDAGYLKALNGDAVPTYYTRSAAYARLGDYAGARRALRLPWTALRIRGGIDVARR